MPALLKAALAALSLPVLVSATGAPDRLGPGELYPFIHQVSCSSGRGTAYRINGGRLLSVAHVTDRADCEINGKVIVAQNDEDLDFSVIESPGLGGFKINCQGFIPGQWYFAVGHARGWEWQTMTQHLATYRKTKDGLVELLGSPTVIPGMSGGIVMNQAGEAVGMVNRYSPMFPQSYSRPLKDTKLCSAS